MRETYELIIVEGVLTESACGNAHTAVDVTVKLRLGTVILLKVGDELCGCGGESKCLRLALKRTPRLKDLLLGGLLFFSILSFLHKTLAAIFHSERNRPKQSSVFRTQL